MILTLRLVVVGMALTAANCHRNVSLTILNAPSPITTLMVVRLGRKLAVPMGSMCVLGFTMHRAVRWMTTVFLWVRSVMRKSMMLLVVQFTRPL